MAELLAIRAAIAASLATLNDPGMEILEDEFFKFQVFPYSNPNPNPQSILVTGVEEFDHTIGKFDIAFTAVIQAFVSETHDDSAQKVVDRLLMGDDSVRKLLLVDKTLGGTVQNAWVADQSGHKVFNLLNTKVLGAEWAVRIIVTD